MIYTMIMNDCSPLSQPSTLKADLARLDVVPAPRDKKSNQTYPYAK